MEELKALGKPAGQELADERPADEDDQGRPEEQRRVEVPRAERAVGRRGDVEGQQGEHRRAERLEKIAVGVVEVHPRGVDVSLEVELREPALRPEHLQETRDERRDEAGQADGTIAPAGDLAIDLVAVHPDEVPSAQDEGDRCKDVEERIEIVPHHVERPVGKEVGDDQDPPDHKSDEERNSALHARSPSAGFAGRVAVRAPRTGRSSGAPPIRRPAFSSAPPPSSRGIRRGSRQWRSPSRDPVP